MDTKLRLDSRGFAFGVIVGIAYLVLGSPLPLATGAGALVYALNALFTQPPRSREPELPALPAGTPETAWVERAVRAVASIDQLRTSARSETIAQRCAAIAVQARMTVTSLHRLAYQASVVGRMANPAGVGDLRDAESRARAQLSGTTGQARIEGEHTLASLTAQRQAAERLDSTRRAISDQIQKDALDLEGVVARVAEIVAITDDTSRVMPIDQLAAELDALREALVATHVEGTRSEGER